MTPRVVASILLAFALSGSVAGLAAAPEQSGPSFFVFGDVGKSGSFPFEPNTTLRQVVAIAQGTKYPANDCLTIVFREDSTTRQWRGTRVRLAEIMKGQDQDVVISPDDIIVILKSSTK